MRVQALTVLLSAAGLGAALTRRETLAACPAGNAIQYYVTEGDTLTLIAKRLQTGVCNIKEANGLTNANFIVKDTFITVPYQQPARTGCELPAGPGNDRPACVDKSSPYFANPFWEIKSGDTYDQISKTIGISTAALENANRDKPATRLNVGDRLNIPRCN